MAKKKLTKAEKELIEYADTKLHLGIKKRRKPNDKWDYLAIGIGIGAIIATIIDSFFWGVC